MLEQTISTDNDFNSHVSMFTIARGSETNVSKCVSIFFSDEGNISVLVPVIVSV